MATNPYEPPHGASSQPEEGPAVQAGTPTWIYVALVGLLLWCLAIVFWYPFGISALEILLEQF
jgi:hypothetical protein